MRLNFYKVDAIRQVSPNSRADWVVTVDFLYGHNKDIVCKGGDMTAFWYDGKWNTSEYDLMTIIDADINKKAEQIRSKNPELKVHAPLMSSNKSKIVKEFKEYTKLSPHSNILFNKRILFSEDVMKKSDYATTQLDYTPKPGPTPAFDELTSVLYKPEELNKILWFMGALLTNNMLKIQKFLYLYGGKGTGKGTIIKIFEMLFQGYWAPIDLSNLTSDGAFATSDIKEVPLLIDDDTDLSNIRKDTNLLKLTAHEPLIINSKYKQTYTMRFEGLLITASNQRFKVRNIDSGITRRAVVATPTNKTHNYETYNSLMSRVSYELPMIAQKAIDLFLERGPSYYEDYVDYEMVEATDYFYGFVREYAIALGDPCSLKKATELYKIYLDDMGYSDTGHKRKVKNELQRYYHTFLDAKKIDGQAMKNIFEGFKWEVVYPDKVDEPSIKEVVTVEALLKKHGITQQPSIFDIIGQDYPAQLTNKEGFPKQNWDSVTTTLKDIDTSKLHYVRVPQCHIIMDFDKKENGEKSLLRNLEAIEKFPPTYTELSKSGKGIHLHYIYDGDETKLKDHIDSDIEIKVYKGKSSLRRMLTMCNALAIAHISSGLPIKEEIVDVYKDIEVLHQNEKKMRALIKGNLEKKYHKYTRPSIDFIVKIFKDAEEQGVEYDLRDMQQDIVLFAMSSTNQAAACMKAISKIKYTTIENKEAFKYQTYNKKHPNEDLYFYDVEVFPNLFIVVFKQYGNHDPVVWINPSSEQIESMLKYPLVGFNNRRYDNHIIYARLIGEDNLSLYRQSKRIIGKDGATGMYGPAYELSYTDIYDYCNAGNKQSLKKWELQLGIKHDELDFPWDQPVPEEHWNRVAEYCVNDVLATEAVFNATQGDYKARLILSELSGLSVNATTNQHTAEIVFDHQKDTKDELVYTDLSETFPGYTYSFGVSEYRGDDPGEGGYVYAEPGIYKNVALLDVASMHPSSIIAMNAFGKYTDRYAALKQIRLHIKHKEFDAIREMFDGKLKPYLDDESTAKDLSNALKTALNSAYGLTCARFDNPFRHPKNVDNIVAKRGALFMIDLRWAVQAKGFSVAHIKTDSIKIPNATPEIIEFIMEFGKKYGYDFEHEATYESLALINKTAYICKTEEGKWSATANPFIEPYVFKRLFTREQIYKEDLFVAKEVKEAAIYLGDKFVGRFAEVYASKTGEELHRIAEDGRKSYIPKTKGYRWKLASDYIDKDDVDFNYYESIVKEAIEAIENVGRPEDILP